jgi:hypothetical protein
MKKRLSVISKTAAAVPVWGIGLLLLLLLLISCKNILAPLPEWNAGGDGETGRALISFGNGVDGARTLLPSEVSFELYKLTIEPVAPNVAGQVTDSILSGSSADVALTPGAWKIHVDAFTDTGGTKKAAEGDSATFTIETNLTTPVSVALKAVSGPGEGTLAVDITGEDNGLISYGTFRIFDGTEFTDPVSFYDGGSYTTSKGLGSSGLDLDISLPPGQYRVYAEIYNTENQAAYINEVAYIYSNLTTPLERVIEADDFTDMTTISGTVWYAENDVGMGD